MMALPVDESRVALDTPELVSYWTRRLDVEEVWLRAAIRSTGPFVDDVRGYLALVRRPRIHGDAYLTRSK